MHSDMGRSIRKIVSITAAAAPDARGLSGERGIAAKNLNLGVQADRWMRVVKGFHVSDCSFS